MLNLNIYFIEWKLYPQWLTVFHIVYRGEGPADSDHNMLEIARKIEMYGITLYPAQDSDGVKVNLAVYHSGILVFQDRNRIINNFSW